MNFSYHLVPVVIACGHLASNTSFYLLIYWKYFASSLQLFLFHKKLTGDKNIIQKMKHGPPLWSHAHDNLKILFSKTIIGLSEPNLTGTFIGWASAKLWFACWLETLHGCRDCPGQKHILIGWNFPTTSGHKPHCLWIYHPVLMNKEVIYQISVFGSFCVWIWTSPNFKCCFRKSFFVLFFLVEKKTGIFENFGLFMDNLQV